MNQKQTVLVQDEEQDVQKASNRVEITADNPSALVCVYGTLRRGNGNYRALLEGKAEFLGEFASEPRFTMYGRRAGFPMVVDKGTTSITYEVYRITNPQVLERCHSLEGCSGVPGDTDNWYDIIPMKTPVGDAWMYAMHNMTRGDESIIRTGNWEDRNN